jgi:UDP-glucose 4-epimerase
LKTCVIGGNGFLGKHFIYELQKSKRDITVVSRSRVDMPNIKSLQVQSLFDSKLEEFISNEVDEVVCLAYATKPKTSFDNPIKDIEENLAQTVHLFKLIANNKRIRKVVYVSSGGAVYGNTNMEMISEDHVTKPISPYGITKLAIEHYANLYHVLYGLPIVIARPANAYGPEQVAKEGQGFIAYAIQAILQNKPVEIFGQKGTIRDYVYVTDVAKALLACLDKGVNGEVYNIGMQQGYTNLEIVEMLQEIVKPSGFRVTINHGSERPFDVKRNVLNIEKIKLDTSWQPSISFYDGLKKTWDTFSAAFN